MWDGLANSETSVDSIEINFFVGSVSISAPLTQVGGNVDPSSPICSSMVVMLPRHERLPLWVYNVILIASNLIPRARARMLPFLGFSPRLRRLG